MFLKKKLSSKRLVWIYQCDLICHVYCKNAEFTLLNLKTNQNIDKYCIFILQRIIEFDEIFGTTFGKLKERPLRIYTNIAFSFCKELLN